MGPPQLHIVLVGFDGLSFQIFEIENAPVFLVPAARDRIVENGFREINQRAVSAIKSLFQQKPAGFNIVPRIDDPAFRRLV